MCRRRLSAEARCAGGGDVRRRRGRDGGGPPQRTSGEGVGLVGQRAAATEAGDGTNFGKCEVYDAFSAEQVAVVLQGWGHIQSAADSDMPELEMRYHTVTERLRELCSFKNLERSLACDPVPPLHTVHPYYSSPDAAREALTYPARVEHQGGRYGPRDCGGIAESDDARRSPSRRQSTAAGLGRRQWGSLWGTQMGPMGNAAVSRRVHTGSQWQGQPAPRPAARLACSNPVPREQSCPFPSHLASLHQNTPVIVGADKQFAWRFVTLPRYPDITPVWYAVLILAPVARRAAPSWVPLDFRWFCDSEPVRAC